MRTSDSMSLGKRGRVVIAHKKCLTPIRWMGCKIAVYDLVVQMKAEGRAERSRARRGTKRRGCRKGRRNARKRRRLVTADPDCGSHPILQPRCQERLSSSPVPVSSCCPVSTRSRFLMHRKEKFLSKILATTVKVDKMCIRAQAAHKARRLPELMRSSDKLALRLVAFARTQGGSELMIRARIYRAISLLGGRTRRIRDPFGAKTLPEDVLESYDDFLEARGEPRVYVNSPLADAAYQRDHHTVVNKYTFDGRSVGNRK